MNSWIYSYEIDKENPNPNQILTYDEVLYWIQFHNITGCVFSSIGTVIIGKFADRIQPKVTIPLSFLFGALSCFALYLSTPSKWDYMVAAPMFHVVLHGKFIVIKSYCYRMYPIQVRATLLGNSVVLTALVEAVVTLMYNYGFQNYGSNMPMLMCAVIDLGLLVLIILFIMCGCIVKQKTEMEEQEESLKIS